ncbi:transcriptional regulator [Candidatus Bathyarchaeota archaeon]|nr:transcriptional regulator [Candidatus Bathyarchaeota archaeon]
MWLELLQSSIEGDFGAKLKEVLVKLGVNINDFSEISKVPKGTLYKIVSGERDNFRISTLRRIISTVKKLEGYEHEHVVGVVTSRGALNDVGKILKFGDKEIKIKEYPATTIEDEIIQGLRAEREGVKGLICGPIAAHTLEKVVNIPIVSLRFEEGPLINALKKIAEKI